MWEGSEWTELQRLQLEQIKGNDGRETEEMNQIQGETGCTSSLAGWSGDLIENSLM